MSYGNAIFGRGHDPIWLTDVECNGPEGKIKDCLNLSGRSIKSCTHANDAGVGCMRECSTAMLSNIRADQCPPIEDPWSEYTGNDSKDGILLMCYTGLFVSFCRDSFTQQDANVACRTIFPSLPVGGQY